MNIRSVSACVLSISVVYAYAEGPDPTTLLRGVQSAREQIPPCRLEVETKYHSELIDNEFTDVIEFDGELRRFEHTCTTPGRPDYSRNVFDGSKVLIYDRDKPQVSIYNLSGTFATPLYDPRILGIAGSLSKDATIRDCFPYQRSSKAETIGPEEIEGIRAWHVQMTKTNGTVLDWWIDAKNDFRVLRYTGNWQVGSRTVRNSYGDAHFPWLPSRVVTEDFGSNGGITSRTEVRILKAEANLEFPKTTWTLEGLDLPTKTVVMDTRSHTFGYWIDGRVMSAEEWNHLPPKGLRGAPWSGRRIVVVSGLAVALAASFVFFLRGKKRQS